MKRIVVAACCLLVVLCAGCGKPKPTKSEIDGFIADCRSGNAAKVKSAFDKWSESDLVNARGSRGETPLYGAMLGGQRKMAKLLMAKGARPSVDDLMFGDMALRVTVNGERIPSEDIFSKVQQMSVQTPSGPKLAGDAAVEQAVTERLVLQLAKKLGVSPTTKQIDDRLQFARRAAGGDLDRMLARQGKTEIDLRNQLAAQQAMLNIAAKGVRVSESEVKKAYDDALKAAGSPFKRGEQVKISAVVASSKARIDEAYSCLAGGEAFGDVAARLSDDPTVAKDRGRLAWISRDQMAVPEAVRAAAFSLKEGDYSKPVAVGQQWIIIRADKKRPAVVTPYAEVKNLVREQLQMRKSVGGGAAQAEIRKFVAASRIEANVPRYESIGDTIKGHARQQGAAGANATGSGPM